MNYAELHCKTNFSFLEGASHAHELVERAGVLGYAALAVTDRNTLAGVVRAHAAAREQSLASLRKDDGEYDVGREHTAIVVTALGNDEDPVFRAQDFVHVLDVRFAPRAPCWSLRHRGG